MSLGYSILLDQTEFNKATTDLDQLCQDLTGLHGKVVGMLDTLEKGWDTPAGCLFLKSCETNLLEPLDRQRLVLDHISKTLRDSSTKYQSVFQAYQELNNSIRF